LWKQSEEAIIGIQLVKGVSHGRNIVKKKNVNGVDVIRIFRMIAWTYPLYWETMRSA